MITSNRVAIGAFTEQALAEKAIEELHKAGFTSEQIGFVTRAQEGGAAFSESEAHALAGTATGVVSGGILGGVVSAAVSLLIPGFGVAIAGGVLAATLGGAAIGAVTGGFVGSLTHIGVPEDEAQYYHEQLESGRTIVTVDAPERYEEAMLLLRECGSFDATVRAHDTEDHEPAEVGTFGAPNEMAGTEMSAYPGAGLGVGMAAPDDMVSPVAPVITPLVDDSAATGDNAETEETISDR